MPVEFWAAWCANLLPTCHRTKKTSRRNARPRAAGFAPLGRGSDWVQCGSMDADGFVIRCHHLNLRNLHIWEHHVNLRDRLLTEMIQDQVLALPTEHGQHWPVTSWAAVVLEDVWSKTCSARSSRQTDRQRQSCRKVQRTGAMETYRSCDKKPTIEHFSGPIWRQPWYRPWPSLRGVDRHHPVVGTSSKGNQPMKLFWTRQCKTPNLFFGPCPRHQPLDLLWILWPQNLTTSEIRLNGVH